MPAPFIPPHILHSFTHLTHPTANAPTHRHTRMSYIDDQWRSCGRRRSRRKSTVGGSCQGNTTIYSHNRIDIKATTGHLGMILYLCIYFMESPTSCNLVFSFFAAVCTPCSADTTTPSNCRRTLCVFILFSSRCAACLLFSSSCELCSLEF